MRKGIIVSACGLLLLVAFGCGQRGPATVPVSGRVTFNGKPVAIGTVMFHPTTGRPAAGAIDAQGQYRLTTFKPGDGAPLGQYRVTIEAKRVSAGTPMPKPTGKEQGLPGDFMPTGPVTAEWLAPEKYSRIETSTLKAEVKSGENTINFDLK